MLKPLVKSAARHLGFDVVKYPPLSPLAQRLKSFFTECGINIVIDVGAFRGKFCRTLRDEIGYCGPIVSIEPSAKTFAALHQAMRNDPNWRGMQLGLSDRAGSAVFHTFDSNPDFNSLLAINQSASEHFGVDRAKHATEEVRLARLDEIWEEVVRGIDTPKTFMKMDTQGHDLGVLRGASGRLNHIQGIQSELSAIQLYDGMPAMSEAIECFRGLGYSPIGFYEVNAVKVRGAVAEFDAIFAKLSP